jgi:hypothetical protein
MFQLAHSDLDEISQGTSVGRVRRYNRRDYILTKKIHMKTRGDLRYQPIANVLSSVVRNGYLQQLLKILYFPLKWYFLDSLS